jgi:hypothetical protein
VFWAHLLPAFREELPEDLLFDGGYYPMALVRGLLAEPESRWWNDAGPQVQRLVMIFSCERWRRVCVAGVTLWRGIERWFWGKLHTATLEATPLTRTAAPLFLQAQGIHIVSDEEIAQETIKLGTFVQHRKVARLGQINPSHLFGATKMAVGKGQHDVVPITVYQQHRLINP